MKLSKASLALLSGVALISLVYIGTSSVAHANSQPVDLQADRLSHDATTKVITASGSVVLEQDGSILHADEVGYDMNDDRVVASGNVKLYDPSGDVHYVDALELTDKMNNGTVENLRSKMADGSRFTANTGEREDGTRTIMHSASYTPCEICKEHPDKAPLWQIKAAKVIHDAEEHEITYKHARFEFGGVPMLYMPYFNHPDSSVEQKSGFLAPSAGYKSELGVFIENSYYWVLNPSKDLTLSVLAMSKDDPLIGGQYRQRWNDAAIEISGGITQATRLEENPSGGIDRIDDDVRGHVLVKGEWHIDKNYRAGIDINWASDDQYMRQYDFTSSNDSDDVLRSEIYLERFSERNYFVARGITFQDLRIDKKRQEDQPEILPEFVLNMQGAPNSVPLIGGTWALDSSFLGLQREGDAQDMNRFSVEGLWKRRFVADAGLILNTSASARGDMYYVSDRDVATGGSGRSRDTGAARFFPQATINVSYPLAKPYETMQALITPELALTIAPDIDVNDDIPNEDSQDVQIDSSNLFETNRFPGLDRVEDRSHITYGLRSGLYGHDGDYVDLFLGQSYRFDDKDNPFPDGSGLNKQSSDIVGHFSAQVEPFDDLSSHLDYRFQLASDDFSSERHEIDMKFKSPRFSLGSRYLYASALEGTDISESREQIQSSISYYLNEEWRARTGATYDLGDDSEGWRKAYIGLDYLGQCLSWSLTGRKNYTADASGESDTEILFRIGLKNIGDFENSSLRNHGKTE